MAAEAGWGFSAYFDDQFNFLEHPELNSLTAKAGTDQWAHFITLLTHRGLNVYEPVGNLLKALVIDCIGGTADPFKLRLCSAVTHFANTILIGFWLYVDRGLIVYV
mgnify:CR=1 FL=1